MPTEPKTHGMQEFFNALRQMRNLQEKRFGEVTILYEQAESEAADLIGGFAAQSALLIEESWLLPKPENLRIYILTSWMPFLFHPKSWTIRVVYALTLPLWYSKLNRQWNYVGGWSDTIVPAIGIKSPRLLITADRTIGQKIYIQDDDVNKKAMNIACHEMTHAYARHLHLPIWLNEGLAMLTVDRYLQTSTIKPETVLQLKNSRGSTPRGYRHFHAMSADEIAFEYIRSYWIVRFLSEEHPELLGRILAERRKEKTLLAELSGLFQIEPRSFWEKLDKKIGDHFS